MVEIKCSGETKSDCMKCNSYFSSHSLHYSNSEKKEVSTITCSIGGYRVFDENGKRLS